MFGFDSSHERRGEASGADGGIGGDPGDALAARRRRGRAPRRTRTGPSKPPPKPTSEYSPIAAPRSSVGAAATRPAVSVPDSAITSIE